MLFSGQTSEIKFWWAVNCSRAVGPQPSLLEKLLHWKNFIEIKIKDCSIRSNLTIRVKNYLIETNYSIEINGNEYSIATLEGKK